MRSTSRALYAPGPLARILLDHPLSGPLKDQFVKMRRASEARWMKLSNMKPFRMQVRSNILEIENSLFGTAPHDLSVNDTLQSLTVARFIMHDPEIWVGETMTLASSHYPRFETLLEIIMPERVATTIADGWIGQPLASVVDTDNTVLQDLGQIPIINIKAKNATLHLFLDTSAWNAELTVAQQAHESDRRRIARLQEERLQAQVRKEEREARRKDIIGLRAGKK